MRSFLFNLLIQILIGDLDNGVDHLAKAVAVCSQPQSLMALFQQTLPPELFQEIIMRLPRIAQVNFESKLHPYFVFFFRRYMVRLHQCPVVAMLP